MQVADGRAGNISSFLATHIEKALSPRGAAGPATWSVARATVAGRNSIMANRRVATLLSYGTVSAAQGALAHTLQPASVSWLPARQEKKGAAMITKRAVVTCWVAFLAPFVGFVPTSAFAQSLVPNPVVWTTDVSFGSAGRFTFIGAVSGIPAGGVLLDGVVGDTSLIFQVTLDAGSTPLGGLKSDNTPGSWVGIALSFLLPGTVQGAGWIPGDEPDALVDFAEAISQPGTTAPWLIMDAELTAERSSDLFFISVSNEWIAAAPQDIAFRIVEGPTAVTVGVATFFSSCAANVTASVTVMTGRVRFDRSTGHYTQRVTLRNTSSGAIVGPISYVLDSLTSGTTVVGANGVTACATPAGSPYITVSVSADGLLSVRERATVDLEFVNPSASEITYTPRILAGPGSR